LATLLVRDWLVFSEPNTRNCHALFSDAINGLITDYCLLKTDNFLFRFPVYLLVRIRHKNTYIVRS
ncbi:MAG: hypothetical protein V3T91_03925, partial [Candidatus Bipolaricaulota bacterium]